MMPAQFALRNPGGQVDRAWRHKDDSHGPQEMVAAVTSCPEGTHQGSCLQTRRPREIKAPESTHNLGGLCAALAGLPRYPLLYHPPPRGSRHPDLCSAPAVLLPAKGPWHPLYPPLGPSLPTGTLVTPAHASDPCQAPLLHGDILRPPGPGTRGRLQSVFFTRTSSL